MKLEINTARKMTDVELEEIKCWMREVWGTTDAARYTWAEADWHVLGHIGSKLVTHVEIVERIGLVNGQSVRFGGIGGVTTRPEWRGHGFASAALQRAAEFMRAELLVEFGLLVCEEELVPFYRRLGWEIADNQLVFDQPSGKTSFPEEMLTMIWGCANMPFPRGTIDLCGLPW